VFATLAGSFPAAPGLAGEDAVRDVLAAQVEAGLEPLTDGGWLRPDAASEASAKPGFALGPWRAVAALADGRPVRHAVVGPYSLGIDASAAATGPRFRRAATLDAAERLRDELVSLASAGCPMVWVEEPAAIHIGEDEAERRLFREAHRRLLEGVTGIHATLAISGGSADGAGPDSILDPPYHSLFVDLIYGPDNWRLVARLPGDRGVICGAMDARSTLPADRELLVWAAHYAASTGGRGLDRVGMAPSGDLGHLTPEVARRKIEGLARAATLAAAPPDELEAGLDRRAVAGPSARLARRRRMAPEDAP
jgi:methionine synthase II (cobalamin-independent)